MTHPIAEGSHVKVTGDTAYMGHDFLAGTVCEVIVYDESDYTYALMDIRQPPEVLWVHKDDVEEVV